MYTGLFNAAKAMDTAKHLHEVSAENLAHIQSPGHRRRLVVQEQFGDHLDQALNLEDRSISDGSAVFDFTAGPLKKTGRTLDLALQGDGFFVVQGPDGPLYTRSGAFSLDETGQLVTVDGRPVQGSGGPIQLPTDATPSSVSVTSEGQVMVEGVPVGTLELVEFDSNEHLRPVGASLFAAGDEATFADEKPSVIQGFVEQSNVSTTDELVRMLIASRYHEAAQQTMQAISEITDRQVSPQ